jgi:large subunit ribosomal protein L3
MPRGSLQRTFLKPISHPSVDYLTPALNPKVRTLRSDIPPPVFPMSDGLNPTPSPQFEYGKKRVGLVGKKLGMTSMWDAFGVRRPVSVIQIPNNTVVSTRFANNAWRCIIGAETVNNLKKLPKSLLFYFRRWRIEPKKELGEFKLSPDACIPTGVSLSAAHFVPGQFVDVQGTSRGKGFQGVMKRWNFKGGSATHGNSKNHRTPGSTGQNTVCPRVICCLLTLPDPRPRPQGQKDARKHGK